MSIMARGGQIIANKFFGSYMYCDSYELLVAHWH